MFQLSTAVPKNKLGRNGALHHIRIVVNSFRLLTPAQYPTKSAASVLCCYEIEPRGDISCLSVPCSEVWTMSNTLFPTAVPKQFRTVPKFEI